MGHSGDRPNMLAHFLLGGGTARGEVDVPFATQVDEEALSNMDDDCRSPSCYEQDMPSIREYAVANDDVDLARPRIADALRIVRLLHGTFPDECLARALECEMSAEPSLNPDLLSALVIRPREGTAAIDGSRYCACHVPVFRMPDRMAQTTSIWPVRMIAISDFVMTLLRSLSDRESQNIFATNIVTRSVLVSGGDRTSTSKASTSKASASKVMTSPVRIRGWKRPSKKGDDSQGTRVASSSGVSDLNEAMVRYHEAHPDAGPNAMRVAETRTFDWRKVCLGQLFDHFGWWLGSGLVGAAAV